MRKILSTVVLVFLGLICFGQNLAEEYMRDPVLALQDARSSFYSGDYERAIKLIKIYHSLSGKQDGKDILSKAQQCQQYVEKVKILEGQKDFSAVSQCYKTILGINPKDPNAERYLNSNKSLADTRDSSEQNAMTEEDQIKIQNRVIIRLENTPQRKR